MYCWDNVRFTFDPYTPEIVFVPTGRYYGMDFIDSYPDMKIIASNTTGDQHIDTAYCKDKDIEVITLKGDPVLEQITAVAELTIGLIIMLTRNVIPAVRSVRDGKWDRYPFGGRKMLKNMNIGIFGCGRIGMHVYRRILHSYCLLYDRKPIGENRTSRYWTLAESDIVTVHITLEGNERLFNKGMFERFKDGAYFINTSRGEIVDEDALLWALESGKLAGAATDVLSGEFDDGFDVTKNRLWQYAQVHDNLIITPHIGGSTEDAWEVTQEAIMKKAYDAAKNRRSS